MSSFVRPAQEPLPGDAAVPAAPPHHLAQLLDAQSTERYRDLVRAAAERVSRHVAGAEGPLTGATAQDLRPGIESLDLDQPLQEPAAALDELERLYLNDAVYFHHRRYMGHLNCPVVLPALVGETVLSAINSSLDTWDQSAGATLIEQRLIEWTCQRIGLGELADGVFTSGGSQSNLQALLLARDETSERAGHTGHLAELLPRMRVLTSQAGHFSVAKSAALLGLGYESVVSVACDEQRRMSPQALAAELRHCQHHGLIPVAVVATAGTTDFGSIDPLAQIAQVCERHGVWMHVDAAYGCGLLVSRRRHLLNGIERADSVTVDFHKSFFQPVSSSAVVVRQGRTLAHATYYADYLNPDTGTALLWPNQVDKSLQTTRRFDALKLWLTLRVMGADGVGALFDRVLELAEQGGRLLEQDGRFAVAAPPGLSTLVFRYCPAGADPDLVDGANRYARQALLDSGSAFVARTSVDGRAHLKLTLLNPKTTLGDIARVLELLAQHAERYMADSAARATVTAAGSAPDTAGASTIGRRT